MSKNLSVSTAAIFDRCYSFTFQNINSMHDIQTHPSEKHHDKRDSDLASLPPLVPAVQETKSLRKARSLDCQQKGRLPSRACMMVGGWESAKPLPSSCEWASNTIWAPSSITSRSSSISSIVTGKQSSSCFTEICSTGKGKCQIPSKFCFFNVSPFLYHVQVLFYLLHCHWKTQLSSPVLQKIIP